ncbi:MAG: D-alanyl-D-alanine carboxypeptidase/D-alanyl-D-alanine-endopeptidase [Deltaproteobacteria bacterium]|nr:D-alanyl-D-alanine carboxypeptidase/D-alanyl-D-alanine-endopeptidase [Deltaproteobacteria bacterium]
MNRARLLFATLIAIGVAIGATSSAQEKGGDIASLRRTLAGLAGKSPGNSKVGIAVVDVMTGAEIFSKHGDEPLNPASNAKIVTAACALKRLGPEFRFTTSLHGRRDGSVIRGPIYFKGHADPTLSTKDLWEMVRVLRAYGVNRVEGGVVVDDSYFDGENLPYAYDQQKNEDAAFRSPIGAASLNHNTLAITIKPGHQGMAPARIFLDPPDYAVLVNDTVTMAQGAHNPKISATRFENRTRIRVWGQVMLGGRPVTYLRRIDNPSFFTGYGLKGVLEASGISVGGSVQTGPLPPGVPKLAEHRSKPLSAVLYEAGKVSNNFVAETALKTIGAEEEKGPGTWKGALDAAGKILGTWGLESESYVYRNGSGLFDANRFSARHFTALLRGAYLDSGIRPEFLSQLATGGTDGTIKSRYGGERVRRRVRAKTGTLADVSTLSGYVFDPEGRRPIAFSILVNNASGYVSASRAYQEKIVTAIAKFLNP